MSSTTRLNSMFAGASSFNQDLSAWKIAAAGTCKDNAYNFATAVLSKTNLSPCNKATTAAAWRNQSSFYPCVKAELELWAEDIRNCLQNLDVIDDDTVRVAVKAWLRPLAVLEDKAAFETLVAKVGKIADWDVSRIKSMQNLFSCDEHLAGEYSKACRTFSADLSRWDVARVTTFAGAFGGAASFTADLRGWKIARATSLAGMFSGAAAFDGRVSDWSVGRVVDLTNVLFRAASFNQSLSGWNVSSVVAFSGMLEGASSFLGRAPAPPLNDGASVQGVMRGWRAGSATIKKTLGPVSTWDVSRLTTMRRLFQGVPFNAALNGWNVARVVDLASAFEAASNYNQPMSSWITSKVTDMSSMFRRASSFRQDLSDWDVARVTTIDAMFGGADAFLRSCQRQKLVRGKGAVKSKRSGVDFLDFLSAPTRTPHRDGAYVHVNMQKKSN